MPALWLDAQLPPQLAVWLRDTLHIDASALRELGLRDADDREIFDAARSANAILLSKDADFVELVSRLGSPPKLVWLTCGNVSNEALRVLLSQRLTLALKVLDSDDVVELA
jgi:predicted nuclease of predicted toxin-antitoxin system